MNLAQRLIARATKRDPDFIIGGSEDPYLLRWWLIPRNPVFNIYLHKFMRSDEDRAHHTHPWLFNISILLDGMYWEHIKGARVFREAGNWKFRWGESPHRVQLISDEGDPPDRPFMEAVPCWTIFITGPRVREWGFLCPQGFVHWKAFTAPHDKGLIGRGCD